MTGGVTGVAKGAAGITLERAQGYKKALIQLITTEYTHQAIKPQTLYPGFIADGLIFLPSGVGIEELRIQTYDLKTKKAVLLNLRIK